MSKFSAVIMRSSLDDFDVIERSMGYMASVRLLGKCIHATHNLKIRISNCTNYEVDKLNKTNLIVSESSRSLLLEIPIREIVTFVDKPSKAGKDLPADLQCFILTLWKDFVPGS
jgi:hypothetical protein